MNKLAISTLIATILAVGAILYINSPVEESLEITFNSWKRQYNIGHDFDQTENMYRMKIFQQTVQQINTHNSLLGRSYELGINQFSHLTKEEFAAIYLSEFQQNNDYQEVEAVPNGPTVDWVAYGAVSPVKNQGNCQATYAFSAVGAIQGISAIFYKTQTQFSVQQIIDCTQGNWGNSGCASGNMNNVFNYVQKIGINSQASYPYTGRATDTCRVSSGFFHNSGYSAASDCISLANALTGRPISVAVDGQNFQSYRTGVFSNCGTKLTLAVLLVGMTDIFWNLKTSWGTTFGQNGYIRIARGNTCGVCMAASYPLP